MVKHLVLDTLGQRIVENKNLRFDFGFSFSFEWHTCLLLTIETHIRTWLNILIHHPVGTFPWNTRFGHTEWTEIGLQLISHKWLLS